MRVLVVEDERELAEKLARALAAAGFATDLAHDGRQADFLGRTEPYDAAVLDLGLPQLDGLSVLRAWRADVGRVGFLQLCPGLGCERVVRDRHTGRSHAALDRCRERLSVLHVHAHFSRLARERLPGRGDELRSQGADSRIVDDRLSHLRRAGCLEEQRDRACGRRPDPTQKTEQGRAQPRCEHDQRKEWEFAHQPPPSITTSTSNTKPIAVARR